MNLEQERLNFESPLLITQIRDIQIKRDLLTKLLEAQDANQND